MTLTDALTGHMIRLSSTSSLSVCFAGDGPAEYDDYEDLAGPDIGAILGKVGWGYSGAMTRVDAFADARSTRLPIASAWATPIVTSAGDRGINISYGVGASFRGQGLAAVLAYVAVAECRAVQTLRFRPEPVFVNVQARTSNDPSQGVARSLQIERDPAASFEVRLSDGRALAFVGFREGLDAFLERGLASTARRLGDYAPGMLTAEANLRHDEALYPGKRQRTRHSKFEPSYGDGAQAKWGLLPAPK